MQEKATPPAPDKNLKLAYKMLLQDIRKNRLLIDFLFHSYLTAIEYLSDHKAKEI
jgi:hypothetical protein